MSKCNDIGACCIFQVNNHISMLMRDNSITAAQCSFDTNFIKIVGNKNYFFIINFQCYFMAKEISKKAAAGTYLWVAMCTVTNNFCLTSLSKSSFFCSCLLQGK